ncbi:MAG: Rieske 2Fe-2S domain-containing protein [Verrucomicrobia bacterium]|nr:Rieske 2Fe-2S domain-containing protein [Verrucomicrobiota bacterium]
MENPEENQVEPSDSSVGESVGQAEGPRDPSEPGTPEPAGERRGFIKFLCAFIGTLISAVPFGAGVWSYLDPLAKRNKGGGGGDGFVRVASLDAIPADGTPAKFSIVADKVDAWNRFSNVSIGAVYLRLVDGMPSALHTVCPHLGCFVDYRPGKKDFFCPCHNSNFKLDGSIVEGVSPRAMDGLRIEVRNKTEVWVKFQNFQPGHSHKVPVS